MISAGTVQAIEQKRSIRWWSMVVSIVWGIGSLPAALAAVMTVFMFDAPGSGSSVLTQLLAGGFWALPLICVASCVGGIVYSRGVRSVTRNKKATFFTLLPVLNIVFIGILFGLLALFCGGSFACRA